MNNSPLILIVDDEQAILQTLQESLQDEGFRIKTENDGNRALDAIGELIPDLVLLDIFMPNCNGLELLVKIKKEYPQQKIILISGFGNIALAVEAVKNGALDFIEKPLNLDDVLSKISFLKADFDFLNKSQQQNNMIDNSANLKKIGIVGESFLFLELLTQVDNLATLNYPLIIYGQHGTGKSIIAKYIHQISKFKNMPFILINCESETNLCLDPEKLFGIVFLRHVDELNAAGQKSLLKFLETDIYQEKNMRGEIRLIASSGSSLFKKVQGQKWNSQLFYKLNITPLEIPCLAKRRHDIPLLINYFVDIANKNQNKNVSFCNLSIRYLRNKNWPVNVAELKSFIDNIVKLAPKRDSKILLPEIQKLVCEKDLEVIEEQAFLTFKSFNEATESFQRRYLIHIIKKNNFDLNQAADNLKLSVDLLNSKIYDLNINLKC